MSTRTVRNRHLFAGDLLLIPLAVYLSFVLRFDRLSFDVDHSGFLLLFFAAAILAPVIYSLCGLYSRYWVYASVDDAVVLAGAVALLVACSGAVYLEGIGAPFVAAGAQPSISIVGIFFFVALSVTAAPRFLVRLTNSLRLQLRQSRGKRTLIVGGGYTGRSIATELRRNRELNLDPVAFLDDDPAKWGMHIAGVPVVGSCDRLQEVVVARHVEHVVIAMPSAPGKVIREVVAACKEAGILPQSLPGLSELIDGKVQVNQLRPVQIEDLLRREPIKTDLNGVRALLRGKRVLVTGAGGSIGSELCRQIMRAEPGQLVLFGHGENSIFSIHNELAHAAGGKSAATSLVTVIGDIRMDARVDEIFARFRPQVVFHAGAHKHVPLMELNPSEAVTNNVLGTRNLLRAAERYDVERFVMISTDKAVNPTNVMGASKRVAELLVHDTARRTGRPFMVTRFGNVLGSRGSVVLTMKGQIAAGGPVTVTHPDMVRFFMTIPEASQLVLQAAVLGRGGEVMMFDMGEPVHILDLARDLIRLSGLREGVDIDIVFTGARPGEKLFEEMFLPEETYQRTEHAKIFIAGDASRGTPTELDDLVHSLERTLPLGDAAIKTALCRLVPEYRPQLPVAPRQEREPVSPVPQPALLTNRLLPATSRLATPGVASAD